ncbi:MAG: hypothetical protein ABII07_04765 [Patescibacteria group bacterium]|nr:hypothetical protein [Patescibacteria group bacterium]
MNSKWLKILSEFKEFFVFGIVVLVLSIVVDLSVISLAQEEEEAVAETGDYECYGDVLEVIAEADEDLTAFLSDSFTSAEPTSEIIDSVLEKYYNDYVSTVQNAIMEAMIFEAGDSGTLVADKAAVCLDLAQKHISSNAEIMKTQIRSSASAKKTTALLDEYKWINERLSDMLMRVSEMRGQFIKIKDSLPGFTKNCVKG